MAGASQIFRVALRILSLLLLLELATTSALAEKRVALVIGNSNYKAADAILANPANDARSVAEALERVGFEVVTAFDLTAPETGRQVSAFAKKLSGSDIGLFFYAGHGLQYQNKNFMVAVDAQLADESSLQFEAVLLDNVIDQMERSAKTSLVFYDACRNNPLARSFQTRIGARANTRGAPLVGEGAAPMEARLGDTLIVFSATPGRQALDGRDGHSPFAAALIKHMESPGLEVEVMLKRVTSDVREVTKDYQTPERLSQLTREFYFKDAVPDATLPGLQKRIHDLEAELEEQRRKTVETELAAVEPGNQARDTVVSAKPEMPVQAKMPVPEIAEEHQTPSTTSGSLPASQTSVKMSSAPVAAEQPSVVSVTNDIGALKPDLSRAVVLRHVGFNKDGSLLTTVGDEGSIRLWDPRTLGLIKELKGSSNKIARSTFSRDSGLMATGGFDRAVQIWKMPSGELAGEFSVDAGRVYSLAFSLENPTRYILAGDGDGKVYIWDLKRRNFSGRPRGHQGPVHAVSFFPDDTSTFLTGGGDGTIKVYAFKGGVKSISAHKGGVFFAKYSVDGKTILSAGADKLLKLWNSADHSLIRTFEGHTKYVLTAAMSPDGKLIASGGGDKSILIWNAETGQLVKKLLGHRQDVESVAFYPDGKRLVSTSEDKTMMVWDIDSGREILTHSVFQSGEYVTYLPDGQYSGSANVDQLLKISSNGIDVDLTDEYRTKFFRKSGLSLMPATPVP